MQGEFPDGNDSWGAGSAVGIDLAGFFMEMLWV